ncbi:integrase core domain-containing protein [Nocardia vaccinii]|uniref:integrase core domain-containing protein n=1 Tax=Nocardia vaccinii TaxID=1822 RepID=UPI0035A2324D
MVYPPPGTPWNNGFVESFNRRLRRADPSARLPSMLVGAPISGNGPSTLIDMPRISVQK